MPEKIVVESPKRFEAKYMRESAIGLTGYTGVLFGLVCRAQPMRR